MLSRTSVRPWTNTSSGTASTRRTLPTHSSRSKPPECWGSSKTQVTTVTTGVGTLALMATVPAGPGASGPSLRAGREIPPAARPAGASDADAIRQRVKEGQKVRVTDDQGREWQGRIDALAPDNLGLLTQGRQPPGAPSAAPL